MGVMIGIFSGLDPRSPGLVLSLQRQAAGRGWEGSMGRVKDLIISKYLRVDLVDFILETWKMFFFLRKPRCRFLKKDSVGLDQDMRPPVRSKPDRWEWEVRFFCWELVDLGIFDGTKAYFKSIRDGRVIVS